VPKQFLEIMPPPRENTLIEEDRRMKFCIWPMLLLLIIGAICCERSSTPASFSDSTPSKPSATRPTTQELLSAQPKRISLMPLPLEAEVPQSWQVKSLTENLFFLEGPAPAGDVQIQLAERTGQTSDKLERLFKAAKRDAETHRDTTQVDVRQQGNLRVFDVQRVIKPGTTNPVDPSAPANPIKLIDWSVTFFCPRGSDYAAYELHFFNLSANQFESDRIFLQKILDSVTSQESGLGVTPDGR